jgi:Holliday junction resolvase-like predicted endonuclease
MYHKSNDFDVLLAQLRKPWSRVGRASCKARARRALPLFQQNWRYSAGEADIIGT